MSAVAAVALGGSMLRAQTTTQAWTNATGNLAYKTSECGTMTLLSAVPDSPAIIAGISMRGLWINTEGTTWSRLSDPGESQLIVNRPTAIVYDPGNPATFWESGIYGAIGIYKTTNGGKTFEAIGDIRHNDHLAIDFSDPERRTMLAGGHEQGQMVYMSVDGGKTWKNAGRSLPKDSGPSTHPYIVDALTLLVNVGGQPGSPLAGIYRSKDGGDSWERVSPHAPFGPPLQTANGVLYWAMNNALLRSTDRGATWSMVKIDGLRPVRPVELPGGGLAAVGQSTLVISTNGGATWTPAGGPIPYAPDGLVYSPQRKAFYMWRGDCREHVPANAVMKLDFSPAAPTQP